MKRTFLFLLSFFGIVLILSGCSVKMSKSELEDSFNSSNSAVLNTLRVAKTSGSNSKTVTQANKGIKIINSEEKKLRSNKSNRELTNDLLNFNKKCRRTLNGIKNGTGKDYFSSTARKIADEYFEGTDTKSIKTYNEWNKKQSEDSSSDESDNSSDDDSSDSSSNDAQVNKVKRHDTTWSALGLELKLT